MANTGRWYLTKEQLENSPSRRGGLNATKELSYRQQTAHFIQDLGQKLLVTQLCINTAMVYMHRFYTQHSFSMFNRYSIGISTLFLAAKVEDQPRRMEQVLKAANTCLNTNMLWSRHSETKRDHVDKILIYENLILQTLGFEVRVEHPHTYVVHCCNIIGASKEFSRAAYFIASNSLHLTTLCLQYKPTAVACFCIHLVSKWIDWEIPLIVEGKVWCWHVDKNITVTELEELRVEYLHVFKKSLFRIINGSKIYPIECTSDSLDQQLNFIKDMDVVNAEKEDVKKEFKSMKKAKSVDTVPILGIHDKNAEILCKEDETFQNKSTEILCEEDIDFQNESAEILREDDQTFQNECAEMLREDDQTFQNECGEILCADDTTFQNPPCSSVTSTSSATFSTSVASAAAAAVSIQTPSSQGLLDNVKIANLMKWKSRFARFGEPSQDIYSNKRSKINSHVGTNQHVRG